MSNQVHIEAYAADDFGDVPAPGQIRVDHDFATTLQRLSKVGKVDHLFEL